MRQIEQRLLLNAGEGTLVAEAFERLCSEALADVDFCGLVSPETPRSLVEAFASRPLSCLSTSDPLLPDVGCCYEAIRDWFHRCKHLFEPDCRERHEVAVNETKIDVDGRTLSVWAAVDCDTLEVLHVDVSPDRPSLDALLFLKEVLTRCRGRPLVRADRGRWYDWPLELLDCDAERETWGNRSLIEAWFGLFKYRTRRFWHQVPYRSTADSTRSWLTAFATLHNATL